jgi:hypothetical protein
MTPMTPRVTRLVIAHGQVRLVPLTIARVRPSSAQPLMCLIGGLALSGMALALLMMS